MKGFLSGMLITLGAYAFLNVGGAIGALLFAFGIICIVKLQIPLYTGVAGTDMKFADKLEVLAQNIAGSLIATFLLALCYTQKIPFENAEGIMATKLATPLYISFIKAIMCGMIVDVSVYLSKQTNSTIPLIFGIPLFILCGFNHSIADVTYIILGADGNMNNPLRLTWYYALCVIGNYVGCNIRQICLNRK